MNTASKIFIIGLPRTGTTSVCAALLMQGYKVAHTAYTQKTFDEAEVIADTPIFYHYKYLDRTYPNAKFIYLARDEDKWVPSIKQLLIRMSKNLLRDDGGFNLMIKESYLTLFSPFTMENISNDNFLLNCYQQHKGEVEQYFSNRPNDILTIDISKADSYSTLLNFLNKSTENNASEQAFPKYNVGGKVTAWKDIKHPNKIESTHRGRSEKLTFV